MSEDRTLQAPGLNYLPSYFDYQLARIRPMLVKLAVAGSLISLLLLVLDQQSAAPTRDLALLFRFAASVPILLVAALLHWRLAERHLVAWLMLLSLLSYCSMAVNFLLLPDRTPYLPVVLFYFHLGLLVLAPMLNWLHLLLYLLLPVPLQYLLLAGFGLAEAYFAPLTLHTVPLLAFVIYTAWHVRRNALAAFELYRRNVELATIDALTNLLNRRAWEQHAQLSFHKARREGLPFAVLITDIDGFKQVNDTWGHAAGDQVLKWLARALLNALRDYDLIGRYGGEEFVIAVSNQSRAQLLALGERVRQLVAAQEIPLDRDTVLRLSTSVGIAFMDGSEQDLLGVVARSDKALYVAKQNGRNRVELHSSAEEARAGNGPFPR